MEALQELLPCTGSTRTVKKLAFYTTCRWSVPRTFIAEAIMQVVYHGSKAVYEEQIMHFCACDCQEPQVCTFTSVMI